MSFLEHQKQNPEFLNNYLKYNRYISFCSDLTVDEEYFDLRTFFRYIKLMKSDENTINNITAKEFKKIEIADITINDVSKVNQNTINNFLCFLSYTLDNCAKTRNKKLASIKRFYEYLLTNNFITYNPASTVRTAKVEKRQPKYLNLSESKLILSKTINSNQKFKIRNYLITCLFLNCSIRLSELIKIDLTDFKLDERTLKIKGKGNVERIIYLNDSTCEALEEYIKIRPKLTKENPYYNALFISNQNKRISKRSVQDIIEQGLYMTFGEKRPGFHTHTLRHTSATLLYNENNTDIFVIKRILGHKSITATEIYTHVSSKKMKEIMENCTISSILEKKEEDDNGKL